MHAPVHLSCKILRIGTARRTFRMRSAFLPSNEMRALERAYSGKWMRMSLLSGITKGLNRSHT